MTTENLLSKVWINRKKKGCRKTGTKTKEKSDKSHEQSHFSPHIIEKEKKAMHNQQVLQTKVATFLDKFPCIQQSLYTIYL